MKEKRNEIFSVKSMVFTALFAALICVAAPFTVPLPGLVPISLATFAIYLTGGMLGGKRAAAAVLVYILLGTAGLPVFSEFSGGFAKLFGITGGYIIGYIPLALLTGIFSDMNSKAKWTVPAGMVLGTFVMYAFGTAWYMIMTGSGLAAALLGCVVPFLIGDGIKIALAALVSVSLRSRLANIMSSGRK